MRIYFTYSGIDFSKYNITNVHFDYIQFTAKDGREFIIEATGELDISFNRTCIDGRFKGELEITDSASAKLKEGETIDSILGDIDMSTFRIGLLDDEKDVEPNPIWKRMRVSIETGRIESKNKATFITNYAPFVLINNDGAISASLSHCNSVA